jgi:hypothetical protein
MVSFLKKYQERLVHRHGWNVPLTCTRCGHEGLPRYDGWTPSMAARFGDRPTIYANLFCDHCGARMTEEAGAAITGMFSDPPTDTRNRRLLWGMLGVLILVPLAFAGLIWMGVQNGLWGAWAFSWLAGLALLITPVTFWFNYRIHSIRHECACGAPDYVFLGMLGRSYCYRCSSCGRLLRLRD